MPEPTREDAWTLVCEWIASDSLRKHVLGVEAAMRAYARADGEDEDLWGITGLVHDLDYERYPDLETGHPRHALSELEARGYPAEVIDAVAGHAEFLGVPPHRPEQLSHLLDGGKYAPMLEETRERLTAYFRPHNERLQELTEIDFGWDGSPAG